MSAETIYSESTGKLEPEVANTNGKRTPAKKAKSTKKAARAIKTAGKPAVERSNKKAEVIAMIKRSKGATLAEIMAAMKWQAHTVRGFVSILGSEGEKFDSSKSTAGERTYKIGNSFRHSSSKRRARSRARGGVPASAPCRRGSVAQTTTAEKVSWARRVRKPVR